MPSTNNITTTKKWPDQLISTSLLHSVAIGCCIRLFQRLVANHFQQPRLSTNNLNNINMFICLKKKKKKKHCIHRDENLPCLAAGALVWFPRSGPKTTHQGMQLPGSCREHQRARGQWEGVGVEIPIPWAGMLTSMGRQWGAKNTCLGISPSNGWGWGSLCTCPFT